MKRIADRLPLVLIAFGALALRLLRLDFQPLWWDEGYSMFFATRDLGTMLARTAVDIHPPFYYALLQFWMTFAGKSAVAVRLLSVAIGVATIPLLYALALKLFAPPGYVIASAAKQSPVGSGIASSRPFDSASLRSGSLLAMTNHRVALIAALLLALSPFHVYYSQEARMYGVVTLLGLASVYLFLELLPLKPGTPKTAALAALYIPITAAALYTQYFAVFILAFEMLVALVVFGILDRRPLNWRSLASWWAWPLAHWFAAWTMIAALYLPWVIYAGPKLYTYVISKIAIEQYAPLDPLAYLAQHLIAFSTGHLTEWPWLAWAGVVLVSLAGLGIFAATRKDGIFHLVTLSPCHPVTLSPRHLVTLSVLVPLALGYLVNLRFPFHPVHGERLLLLAAPAFYLLAALGIHALWNRRALFGALALSVVALISGASLYDFYTAPRYPQDDYRPLIAEMQTLAQPGDVFLAIYPWQIGYLEAYYTGAPLNVVETPNAAWINHPTQMQRDLAILLEKDSRVWLPALQTLGRILENALDANLRPRAYSVVDDWFGTTRLELFALAGDPATGDRSVSFGDDVTLSKWGVANSPVAAGQAIVRVLLHWQVDAPTGFKASLRLLDAKGNVWMQDDREIVGGLQRVGLAVPIGAPPGEYALQLVVYRARDDAQLRVADSDRAAVPLARVNVISPAQANLAAIPNRMSINLANAVRLVGYAAPSPMQPGNPASITFFWQATRALDRDYAVVTRIQDARGNIYATTQAAPARGIYPTTRWQPNEIVRDPQTLTLRGDTPAGDYRIVVALVDAAHTTRLEPIEIGAVTVKGRAHYFGAPAPSNKSDARFGDLARLVGYDVSRDQRSVRIVLYWQALGSSETASTVFVHLVDETGTLRAQRDQIPGAGAYPTTSWVKGEYLVDVYDVEIPRGAPAGEYAIQIGMYDPASGARLPAFDASNQPIGDYSTLPARIAIP